MQDTLALLGPMLSNGGDGNRRLGFSLQHPVEMQASFPDKAEAISNLCGASKKAFSMDKCVLKRSG